MTTAMTTAMTAATPAAPPAPMSAASAGPDRRLRRGRLLLALLLTALAGAALGAGVGDELPALSLKDAHGIEQTLDDGVRRIYATPDRAAGSLIKDAMQQRDQKTLDAQRAIIIAEISEAPGFVRRLIRGGLRDRPYRHWLDESGQTRGLLPYRPGQVTVLDVERRRIVAVRHVADVDALRRELAGIAAPTTN